MTLKYFQVVNWHKFQQYKDREPKWIKLHRSLRSKYEWCQLDDAAKGHLIGIWMLAADLGNKIPWDYKWIEAQIGATTEISLDQLLTNHFIEPYRSVHRACTAGPYTETETETETETDSRRDDEGVVDPKKFVFDAGVQLLVKHGNSYQKARAVIGMWLKDSKMDQVAAAVIDALGDEKAEPIGYITARLQDRGPAWVRDQDAANARVDQALEGWEDE